MTERHNGTKPISEHPANTAAPYPRGAAKAAVDMIADVSFSGAAIWLLFLSLSLEPNR